MRINNDPEEEKKANYEGIEPNTCCYCGEQMIKKEGFCSEECQDTWEVESQMGMMDGQP